MSNYVTVISMVYMFCLLSGEYTAVNGAASFLLGINGIVAAVGTAVITLVYTAVGGARVRAVQRTRTVGRGCTLARARLARAELAPPRSVRAHQASPCRSSPTRSRASPSSSSA